MDAISNLIRQAILLVINPECFDKYFLEFNFLDGPCFLSSVSKALGIGIILGSVLVKLPQILKIYNNKSGEGVSLLSVTLDLTAITVYASYTFLKQFPFSAWGDATFVGLQTLVIAVLILFYQGSTVKAVSYLGGYVLILGFLVSGIVPIDFLWTLQGMNIFVVVSGKMVQAYSNYSSGDTGQLAGATLLMLLFGSLARIFTSIQETGDFIVVLLYIASSSANGVLVGQWWYYWEATNKKLEKQKVA